MSLGEESGLMVLDDAVLALLFLVRLPIEGREKDWVRLDNIFRVRDFGSSGVGVDCPTPGGSSS